MDSKLIKDKPLKSTPPLDDLRLVERRWADAMRGKTFKGDGGDVSRPCI